MTKLIKIITLSVVVSIIFSSLASYLIINKNKVNYLPQTKTKQELIKEFYDVETAVHVSPHGIRKGIAAGDDSFILVDLRSQEEYENEHIIGAVSIPAYKDPDTSAYNDVDRIVNAFSELDQSKDIIVYCYSIPCMTGRKIGKMLADHDIYVQHLAIGWNEWKYYWNSWNHEHEWDITDVNQYVASGSEPGKMEVKESNDNSDFCPIEGELGC
ncbi:MAG TPA: rhodanese-like domain-containing protein [Patescibacteria group bacterium]|nr:rhodanese-like domain-containing protein [Patescibacteria group bacterium]